MTRKTKPPVAIYSALADTSRCRIVEILRDGAKPVHELADAFSISRPAISRHLRVLKTAGLVVEVKKGRENLYSLRASKLDKALEWIIAIKGGATEPERIIALEPAIATVADAKPVATKPPRKPKAAPAVVADEASADDAIAPAVARAAKQKAISQMGFDF